MPTGQVLVLCRHLNASPAHVFRAWSDPQQLRDWWGPDEGDKNILVDADVRVGGLYHIVTRAPNGDRYNFRGRYCEIVPDRKLSFTWNTGADNQGSVVTAEVEREGRGTQLTLIHEGLPTGRELDGCEQRWKGALQKLERLVSH